MNYYKTILTILVLLGIVYTDVNNYLVAHYPFAGDYNDVTGNHAPAENNGTSWTDDKDGNTNSALSFTGSIQFVQVPVSTINGLKDLSLCFWTKSTELTKFGRGLFAVRNDKGLYQNMFLTQRLAGLSSEKSKWVRKIYTLQNGFYLTGQWQHICFSRDSVNSQMNIYADGQLFETVVTRGIEDGHALDANQFVLGTYQGKSIFRRSFQYYGSLNDFRVYNKSFTAADAAEVRDSTTGPPTDDLVCESYLNELYPNITTEEISFPRDNFYQTEFDHQYDISFNNFTLDTSCFETKIWIGNNQLYHTVYDNKIVVRFPWKEAINLGCVQETPYQQQCQVYIQLYYKGDLKYQKFFTSIVNTPNLDDLSQDITLTIIDDDDESLLQFDQTMDTQLKFCPDITCSYYITPSQIVRNTDVYVEFKVNTPGYDQYYPIHKRLTIDGQNVAIQNQAAIDQWQESGRIVYHIRPPVANPTALLVIGVSLSKDNPQDRRRRILLEQQDELLEEQRDNIGKYIRVQIVDHDGKLIHNKQSQEEDYDQNVTIAIIGAVAAVVLFVSLAGIGVFYKLRKSKAQNLQNSQQQEQYLEPSTPQSTNIRENKLNIQVE